MALQPSKIYLELDAYELGNLLALIPSNAYLKMDDALHRKINDAKKAIANDRTAGDKIRELETELAEPEDDIERRVLERRGLIAPKTERLG